jgi:hypothetical protein
LSSVVNSPRSFELALDAARCLNPQHIPTVLCAWKSIADNSGMMKKTDHREFQLPRNIIARALWL